MFLIISFTSKMKIMFETRFIIIIITIIITIIILSARKVKPEAFADDMDQDQTAHNVQSDPGSIPSAFLGKSTR